jgi:hypothetical protein
MCFRVQGTTNETLTPQDPQRFHDMFGVPKSSDKFHDMFVY